MICDEAKERFPDLGEGPVDAELLLHIESCRSCSGELRAFRSVLDIVSEYGESDVPDPGEQYWARFLPRVQARLVRPPEPAVARSGFSIRAAAAALLMAGAAVGALSLPRPAQFSSSPVLSAGSRLDSLLLRLPGLAPEVAAEMLGTDPIITLDAARMLEALEETDRAASLSGDWADDRLRAIIDGLSPEQTARLMAEFAADEG